MTSSRPTCVPCTVAAVAAAAPVPRVRMVLHMAQNETCDYGLFPSAAAAKAFARDRIVEWCDGDAAREAAPVDAVLAEWARGCGEVFVLTAVH